MATSEANQHRSSSQHLEPLSLSAVPKVIPERPTSAGGTSRRVTARSKEFQPPSTYESRDCIEFVLSIPNEPRIPGQVKNRAVLLKLMNSPDYDNEAYYHFQNGELVEKSNSLILSEETELSLIGRGGGPVYTWAPMSFGPANTNLATTVQPDPHGHHYVMQRFQVKSLDHSFDLRCLYDTGVSHPLIFHDDFGNLGLHANINRPEIQITTIQMRTVNGNINRQAVLCDVSHIDDRGNVISGPRTEVVIWDHARNSTGASRLSGLMPQETAWTISRPGKTSVAFGLRKQETLSAEIRASGG